MSSVVVRILLLALAACALVGVFAVQRIESAGSPVGQPAVPRTFSPNGDGVKDTLDVRYSLRRREPSIVVVRRHGSRSVTRELRPTRTRRGTTVVSWDGMDARGGRAPEGDYDITIELPDRSRTFPLHRPVTLDVTPPRIVRAVGRERAGAPFMWVVDANVIGAVVGRKVFVGTHRMVLRSSRRDLTIVRGVQHTHFRVTFRELSTYPLALNPVRFEVTDPAGNAASRRVRVTPVAQERTQTGVTGQ